MGLTATTDVIQSPLLWDVADQDLVALRLARNGRLEPHRLAEIVADESGSWPLILVVLAVGAVRWG